MELLFAAILLAAVAWFVTAPLRTGPGAGGGADRLDDRIAGRRAALEARKEAKYREIRDAELDHATGKLSDRDHAELDAELRAEAIAILRELDELDGTERPSG